MSDFVDKLRAIVGGRNEPTIRKGINRATSYTEVGSSIKPLSVYGPALDLGYSPGSITANMDGPIVGWNTEKGYPSGGLDSRYGPVTFRRAIVSSLNVPAARMSACAGHIISARNIWLAEPFTTTCSCSIF